MNVDNFWPSGQSSDKHSRSRFPEAMCVQTSLRHLTSVRQLLSPKKGLNKMKPFNANQIEHNDLNGFNFNCEQVQRQRSNGKAFGRDWATKASRDTLLQDISLVFLPEPFLRNAEGSAFLSGKEKIRQASNTLSFIKTKWSSGVMGGIFPFRRTVQTTLKYHDLLPEIIKNSDSSLTLPKH